MEVPLMSLYASVPYAVPSAVLSPALCCYLAPFPFLLYQGMMDEFTQTLAHHVCALYSLLITVYHNFQVAQR